MIWAAFSDQGTTDLCFIEGNMDSTMYLYYLNTYLLPYAHRTFGTDFIYQQDNASVHKSNESKDWFREEGIEVLDWPSKSPDLNPIENLWGILARKVYDCGKVQFKTKEHLINRIKKCWNELDQEVLKKLIYLVPNRCIKVIETSGGKVL